GKAFGLYDAPLREIHSLAPAPDGSIYALALGEAAATTRAGSLAGAQAAESSAGAASAGVMVVTGGDETGAVQLSQPTPPARSRNDLTGAKFAVLRILPDGGTDVLWSSTSVTAFAVAPAPQGGVLVGTSDKGRIYLL